MPRGLPQILVAPLLILSDRAALAFPAVPLDAGRIVAEVSGFVMLRAPATRKALIGA